MQLSVFIRIQLCEFTLNARVSAHVVFFIFFDLRGGLHFEVGHLFEGYGSSYVIHYDFDFKMTLVFVLNE